MARLPDGPVPPFVVQAVPPDPDAALGTEEWLDPAFVGAFHALDELAKNGISEEERHRMIAEAAYYRAQGHAFDRGYEIDDWLEAEAEVDAWLTANSIQVKRQASRD